MPLSHTLTRRREFAYQGSPTTGTEIEFGDGHAARVDADEYAALRIHFGGRIVAIGASRDNPPPGSLGAWLRDNLPGRPAIASYVAPVLIEAGWATRINNQTIQFL